MEEKNIEIDLVQLTRNMMVRLFHYILRRYRLLGIFAIIGIFIGIIFYLKDKNKFENTIVGTSYVIHPTVIVEIINSLQDVNKTNKAAIMEYLNLKPEEAEALLLIEADTIETLKTPDIQKFTTIKVKIRYKSNLNLSSFSKHLCEFVDSNIFIKHELQLEKNRSKDLIDKYNYEISKIDSVQKKMIESKGETISYQTGNMIISSEKNNRFQNDIVEMEKEKQIEIKRLNHITGFTIINENKGTKIKEVPLVEAIFISMAIFFGIGFLISIVLEFKRQVHFIERNKVD